MRERERERERESERERGRERKREREKEREEGGLFCLSLLVKRKDIKDLNELWSGY